MSSFIFVSTLSLSIVSISAYTDIIDTSDRNQFNSAEITCSGNGACKIICDELNSCYASTITCPAHFVCDIECLGNNACQNAMIECPYGEACNLNCGGTAGDGGTNACRGATVHSEYASHFILDGCIDQLSCNGMNLYLPPNDGEPKAIVNGGGTLASVNSEPLNLYAIFGWLDVSIRNYQGTFADHSNTQMHCLPDYSASCTIASDSWTCTNTEDICNIPPTSPPTTSPTAAYVVYVQSLYIFVFLLYSQIATVCRLSLISFGFYQYNLVLIRIWKHSEITIC